MENFENKILIHVLWTWKNRDVIIIGSRSSFSNFAFKLKFVRRCFNEMIIYRITGDEEFSKILIIWILRFPSRCSYPIKEDSKSNFAEKRILLFAYRFELDIFQEWPTIRRCRACDDYLFRDDIRSRHKISRGERLARKCPAPIRSSLLTSAIIALINWPPAHLAGCGPRGYVAVWPPVANLVSRTEEARLLPQPPPIISSRERGITLCHCALIEDLIFKATGGAWWPDRLHTESQRRYYRTPDQGNPFPSIFMLISFIFKFFPPNLISHEKML